jgi:hypothetical protein
LSLPLGLGKFFVKFNQEKRVEKSESKTPISSFTKFKKFKSYRFQTKQAQ